MQIDQKAVFDNILFTTAAEKLKTAAGGDDQTGLRKLAKDLHDKASQLHSAATAGQGKDEAHALASAVGADENNGIRKAFKDLNGADDSSLTQKAKDVKTAYSNGSTGVKERFNKVKEKETVYKSANKEKEYQAVDKAWNAFNNLYQEALKAEINTNTLLSMM